MKEPKEEKEYGFITFGVYKQKYIPNKFYNIDDFLPVLINNKPKMIGEGRFSKVYLYKYKNNDSLFALKKISINKILESGNNLNIIKREINIHSKIVHENIVQFYSVKEEINEISILLEYCKNGSIFELISKNGFDEYKTYLYFSQVVNAVYFLHKNNLIHRDIKPENILLDSEKIKLCDFGWCCEINSNNRNSFCGTFEYMAPEIINEIPYGKPVDIWALGILLYEFYYGISPFNAQKSKDIINNILSNKLFFPNKKSIPNDMKDLIIKMLNFNALERYTIEQVVMHPWFKKCNEEFNKKNTNLNIPINEAKEIKITKINRNKNDFLLNSFSNQNFLKKENNLGVAQKEKDIAKENLPNNNNYSYNSKTKVKKIINIDINTNEDNNSPIKDSIPLEIINSINAKINNIQNNNPKKENNEMYKNAINNTNKSLIEGKNNKIKNNNKENLDKKSSIEDTLNHISFYPMYSILEETNNEINDEKLKSLPKHATVVKIQVNKNDNINTKEIPSNINSKKNIEGNQTYNGTTMNNVFLNNNYYTINYYGNLYNNIEYKINYNNNYAHQFPAQYYMTYEK